MPTARQEISSAVLDGKIYAIAGYDVNGASTATVEVYDPAANTWAGAHPIPFANNHNNAAVAAGRLYVFGGEIPQLHAEVEAYSPLTNSWRTLPNMPNPRHGLWASVIGGSVYLPGGGSQQGFGASNINDVFTSTVLATSVISTVTLQNGAFEVSFSTVADATYTLQENGMLRFDGWSNVISASGTGGVLSLQDAAADAAPKFYRVLAQRP